VKDRSLRMPGARSRGLRGQAPSLFFTRGIKRLFADPETSLPLPPPAPYGTHPKPIDPARALC